MLCQLCALFCAKSYAFFCYILPLLPQKLPVTLPLRPLCIVLHGVQGIVVSILWSFYAYFCDILQFKGTNLLKIPLTLSFNPGATEGWANVVVEKHRYCGNSVLILWNCDGDSVMLDQMLVFVVEKKSCVGCQGPCS